MCFVKVREVRYQIVLHMLRCFAVEEGKVVKDRQNLPKRQREGLLPSLYVREQRRKMSRYKMWFGLNYVVIVFINYFFFLTTTTRQAWGGREEWRYTHISHLKSRKIRCFVNCVDSLSPVKTQQAFTLYILVN